jgi:threonine dehydratase
MPDDAPAVKVAAVRSYGAEIVFCKQSEREAVCEKERLERRSTLVHPFDDPRVVAGQGTAAVELFEDVEDLDLVIAPVGGGGLLSGTTLAAAALRPGVRVVGAEPEAVDDAYRSLQTGVRQPRVPDPTTWADGLLTGLGEIAFSVLTEAGTEIVTITEGDLLAATLFHLQRMKLVVEPSGAAGLAALRNLAGAVRGQRVGVIISGGNTDFRWLEEALAL